MACVRQQATCSPNPATSMIALLLLCQYFGKTFANFEIFNRTYVPNSENKLPYLLMHLVVLRKLLSKVCGSGLYSFKLLSLNLNFNMRIYTHNGIYPWHHFPLETLNINQIFPPNRQRCNTHTRSNSMTGIALSYNSWPQIIALSFEILASDYSF